MYCCSTAGADGAARAPESCTAAVLQVLAGWMLVLRPHESGVDVFLSPHYRTANFDGAWGLVMWSKACFLTMAAKIACLDVAWCCS